MQGSTGAQGGRHPSRSPGDPLSFLSVSTQASPNACLCPSLKWNQQFPSGGAIERARGGARRPPQDSGRSRLEQAAPPQRRSPREECLGDREQALESNTGPHVHAPRLNPSLDLHRKFCAICSQRGASGQGASGAPGSWTCPASDQCWQVPEAGLSRADIACETISPCSHFTSDIRNSTKRQRVRGRSGPGRHGQGTEQASEWQGRDQRA